MRKLVTLFSIFLCASFFQKSVAQLPVITLQEFSAGYTSPLDIQNCGDGRLFIVQQNGYIYTCDSTGVKSTSPFLDVHTLISQSSERGLLGLAFHPNYFENGYFYIYYTQTGDGALKISRFSVDSLNANIADPNSELNLLTIAHPTYSNHNGGCLMFGRDGYLHVGTGDGGSFGDPSGNAQNTKKYLGKLLRIDVNNGTPYAIPGDNPFVDDTTNYYPEIWAYGLRNPWRFTSDRITGELWIGDVGQDAWEEIDYAMYPDSGGQNYGWDCYEGNHTYQPNNCSGTTGLTFPVAEYQHSSGSNGDCTVTGGYVYRGAKQGNLYGKYLFADYCSGKFRLTEKNGDGTFTTNLVGDEVISQDEYVFATFGEDRYGELYVTDITHGKIYAVLDTACKPSAAIVLSLPGGTTIDSMACAGDLMEAPDGPGFTYQWMLNGVDIPGADVSSYVSNDTGMYTVRVTNLSGCINTSDNVHVGSPTDVFFSGLDSIYCLYESADTLFSDPPGGIFQGNGIIGNVFDPSVAGPGTHLITYTYTNEFGCSSTSSQEALVDPCTGLNESWEQYGINLFPNPNSGNFTIMLKDTNKQITQLSIWTSAGQLVSEFELSSGNSGSIAVDVSGLSDGFYFLRMNMGNNAVWQKIMIQHP